MYFALMAATLHHDGDHLDVKVNFSTCRQEAMHGQAPLVL
jgi:hypothetical protein